MKSNDRETMKRCDIKLGQVVFLQPGERPSPKTAIDKAIVKLAEASGRELGAQLRKSITPEPTENWPHDRDLAELPSLAQSKRAAKKLEYKVLQLIGQFETDYPGATIESLHLTHADSSSEKCRTVNVKAEVRL